MQKGSGIIAPRTTMRLAGLRLSVEREEGDPVFAFDSYAPFYEPNAAEAIQETPDLTVRGAPRHIVNAERGESVFDCNGVWSLRRDGDEFIFLPYSTSPVPVGGEAVISKDWRHVEVFGLGRTDPVLAYPLDELIFMHLLPDLNGFLLHASAILWRGKAYVFAGRSGAGKTTMAGLWKKSRTVKVLSDDRLAVRIENGVPMAHGTPWHGTGKDAAAGSAPIEAIYLLGRGGENRIEQIDKAASLRALMPAVFLPCWDSTRTENALDALTKTFEETEVAQVFSNASDRVVETLWP